MRWLVLLAALTACDRVFGLGDPYQDAHAVIDDGVGSNPDAIVPDDSPTRAPELLVDVAFDGTLLDSVTHSFATCTGTCTTYAGGHLTVGSSFSLDGATCVTFDFSATALPNPPEVTLALWTHATTGTAMPVLSRPRFGSVANPHSWKVVESSSAIVWDTSTVADGDNALAGPATIDGQWHHIAVTLSAIDKAIYLDGQKLPVLSPVNGTDYGAGVTLYIGCDGSGGAGNFTGLVDDLKIYSGALSAAGINLLANQ